VWTLDEAERSCVACGSSGAPGGQELTMRVGIDLTALIARPTGVDRYIIGMISSLRRFAGHEYVLFINAEDRKRTAGMLDANTRAVVLSRRWRAARLFFQQVLLPLAVQSMRIDVVHSPAFIMPWHRGRAGHLLTVHDMTSFLLPRCHPGSRRGRLYEAAVRGSVRRADLVSVPSHSVRRDVLRLVPDVQPGRIRAIPCGIDEAFVPRDAGEVATVLDRLAIRWPYILYVGTLDPRKNLLRLVESYARLVERSSVPEHLVLAGQFGWSVGELLESLRLPALRDRVHVLGYVAEQDLPYVYSGARLFAYPSLLEGFGFPPLEAMACGVPVVASDSSSLRDNLEGAAELVRPEDVQSLAVAMERLLTDEPTRIRYVAAGFERAANFRWEKFAQATAACYEEIGRR
ncbi:MAG: glycosyltransferase family 4 protein, partial [Acidobacteriota bacterium]|nr:glycosyltransferase family 4 protein [Acidobacteriota bacterium]